MSSENYKKLVALRQEVELLKIARMPRADEWRRAWRAREREDAAWEGWASTVLNDLRNEMPSVEVLAEKGVAWWKKNSGEPRRKSFREIVRRELDDEEAAEPDDDPEGRGRGAKRPHGYGAGQLATDIMTSMTPGAQASGAMVSYVKQAGLTGVAAGQHTLDALGLNKTFAWAGVRDMPRAVYAVRGSKVVQGMYGAHVNDLAKIVINATNPAAPKVMGEITKEIRENWTGLTKSQAERIARTEAAAVWETSSWNTMRANGVMEFESLTATGPSIGVASQPVCPICVEFAANSPWTPDNIPQHPPLHPNCRCTLVPFGDYLPPREIWTGQDMDMCGNSSAVERSREQRSRLEKMAHVKVIKAMHACLLEAPFPGVPNAAELLRGERAAVLDEIKELQWEDALANQGAKTATSSALAQIYEAVNINIGNAQVFVLRDAQGVLRGATAFYEKDGKTIHIAQLGSTTKGGGRELVSAAAKEAKIKNLPVEADPINEDAVRFNSKIGFSEPNSTGRQLLEGDARDALAAWRASPLSEVDRIKALESTGYVKPMAAPAPLAEDLAARREALRNAFESGIESANELSGGSMPGAVEKVVFKDGTIAVRKKTTSVVEADSEYLSSLVAGAIGARVPVVSRLGERDVLFEFVEGKTGLRHLGAKVAGAEGKTPILGITDSIEGYKIGILDVLINNTDRHAGNWLIGKGDIVTGIDQGNAFRFNYASDGKLIGPFSPFGAEFLEQGSRREVLGMKDNLLTKADVTAIRERLYEVRLEFVDAGQSVWFAQVTKRLDELETHAKGKVNIIAEGKAAPASVQTLPFVSSAPLETPVIVQPRVSGAVDGFTVPSSSQSIDEINSALRAIDKTHKWPEGMPRLEIDVLNKKYLGTYSQKRTSGGKFEPEKISLNDDTGTHISLTFAHEIGHFIDNWGLSPATRGDGNYLTDLVRRDTKGALKDLLVAIRKSDQTKELKAIKTEGWVRVKRRNGVEESVQADKRYINYVLDPVEQFARAYAQYVAEKSGDLTMLAHVDAGVNTTYPIQWTKSDFAPISKLMDTLFEEVGLL